MANPRSFRQINTQDRELQLIQDNVERAVAEAINSPLLNGRLVADVALNAGLTKWEHKLARTPRGYLVVDKNNTALIYTAAKDDKFLTLNASVACTVTLWVF